VNGPGATLASLLVGLLCFVWGSTWLAIQFGLADVPPFTGAAARFFLAAVCMVFVVRLLAHKEGGERPGPRLVLCTAIFNFFLTYGSVYWAEQYLPSAIASILFALFPIFVALLAHFFLQDERLGARHVIGFTLGFLGVILLFCTDVQGHGPHAVTAVMVFLVCPVSSAVGTVLLRKWGQHVSSLRLNRDGMFVGAALLGVVALFVERDVEVRWTPAALGSLVYLAMVGTVLAFGLYFWLLRYAPAYKLAVIPYVTPVVAVTLGFFVAGEPFGATTAAGLALILLGVLMVTRDPRCWLARRRVV
jgi:drug/metabolite transporter (DMT)-like permease